MESVKILNWIETNVKTLGSRSKSRPSPRYGSGNGSGCGWGDGSGNGSGHGDDCGSGNSWGCGLGSSGSGSGSGYGWGCGSGDGDAYGWGRGSSDGWGVSSLGGEQIFYIDRVPTIIKRIAGNLAKGFTVNLNNFTKSTCYVVKGDGYFAHGATAKEAQNALLEKILEDKSEEERMEEFINHFPKGKKAKGSEYYDWHHILTGSCKFGRDEFVRQNNIDLSVEYTPEEFIEITKNAYGSEIIISLKKKYEER